MHDTGACCSSYRSDCVLMQSSSDASLPDTSAVQGVEDVALPRGLNLCQNDVLIGRDDDRQLIALDDSPESHLELALQPATGSALA